MAFKRLHRSAKRWAVPLFACVLASGLTACVRPSGDLGRAAPSTMHDQVLPAAGKTRAWINREQVSDLNYTDEELEMRNRIWRYIIAPHSRDWFHNFASEMQRTRIIPASDRKFSPGTYFDYLKNDRYRSSRVRYNKLSSDIGADSALAPKAFAIICKVIKIDQQREIAAQNLQLNDRDLQLNRVARKQENKNFISWFIRAMRFRLDAYDYALARLLIDTPHIEARLADRQYQILLPLVERAERGEFCVGAQARPGAKNVLSVASRFSKVIEPKVDEPKYLK